MNRTLKEMSRCMLIDGGCKPELWAHAIDTAAYLHNRSSSSRNPTSTPYEVMWKHKPDVRHLRVFGSVCYALVQKQQREAYMHKLHVDSMPTTNIAEDNAAALKWCYNPINHGKQKHIPVAYHFIREQVAQFGHLNIVPISTEFQLADLFTKVLPAPRFRFLVNSIRGLNPTPLVPRTVSETLKDMVSEKANEILSLKERIAQAPEEPTHKFFDDHFQEPDPVQLQSCAGLRPKTSSISDTLSSMSQRTEAAAA